MNVSRKFAKKLSFYVTFCACAAALWMLVVRFDYPKDMLLSYGLILLLFLITLIVLAAVIAFIIHIFSSKTPTDVFASPSTNTDNEHE